MVFVKGFLVVVEVLSCLLLLGVILLQKSKGQGVGLAFGAAMGETLFGARAGNVLTRATVVLAIVFLVNTALLAMVGSRARGAGDSVTDAVAPTPPPTEVPTMPMGGEPQAMDVGDLPETPAAALPEQPAPAAEPVAPVTAGDQPLAELPPAPAAAEPPVAAPAQE
jgi:preprotein translocase subunit SecG